MATKLANHVADELNLAKSDNRVCVWVGDGHQKGCTIFSRGGEWFAYNHESDRAEKYNRLVLVEGNGEDGDENGLNSRPDFVACDFDAQYGLWLLAAYASDAVEIPEGCEIVWDSHTRATT